MSGKRKKILVAEFRKRHTISPPRAQMETKYHTTFNEGKSPDITTGFTTIIANSVHRKIKKGYSQRCHSTPK